MMTIGTCGHNRYIESNARGDMNEMSVLRCGHMYLPEQLQKSLFRQKLGPAEGHTRFQSGGETEANGNFT